ncbi:hypothetical protein ACFV7Q_11070 [Streptomyces sp. NPDC059851]|uniref:hypothetical protein n=1 Tax=Streptomyces sp. NPDC059851 TaxID=3346971 RepID=UPI003655ECA7
MSVLQIALQEDFQGEHVVVSVDGTVVLDDPSVHTRRQIGLARSVEVPVRDGQVTVDVSILGGPRESVAIDTTVTRAVLVDLGADGALAVRARGDLPGYVCPGRPATGTPHGRSRSARHARRGAAGLPDRPARTDAVELRRGAAGLPLEGSGFQRQGCALGGATAASWEFETLLGLGPDRLDAMAKHGHPTREYVVFGTEWWLYVCNRLAEDPQRLLHAVLDAATPTRH